MFFNKSKQLKLNKRLSIFSFLALSILLSTLFSTLLSNRLLAEEIEAKATAPQETDSQENVQSEPETELERSPWIFTPLLSVNPKLSTSIGALAAYMHKFDPKSPASMFGITGNYSDTKSWTAVVFAKAYFDQDTQRVSAAAIQGKIKNDYDDYLGSGQSVKTEDELDFFILRYSHEIWENWYLGAQILNSHYQILGLEDFVPNTGDAVTDAPNYNKDGIYGFDSIGIGATVEFDSRDRPRSATKGNYLLFHNIAYRKSFGGDYNFDTYDLRFTNSIGHGNGHVLAINTSGRWTQDAPISGYSSVFTKGYTRGQYLAPHTTSIELDERIRFTDHWGMTIYGAIACLYGKAETATGEKETAKCSDSDNLYPSTALGTTYALKPKEGIVIRAEAAVGKGDNNAFYLSFGQPF